MTVKQVSILLENRVGALIEITELLEKYNINIRAITVSDTVKFGILRLIVDKPQECAEALKGENLTVSVTNVIAVALDDKPGGLSRVAKLLAENGISLDYVYAYVSHDTENACVIIRVGDSEFAERILMENGITVLGEKEVYGI